MQNNDKTLLGPQQPHSVTVCKHAAASAGNTRADWEECLGTASVGSESTPSTTFLHQPAARNIQSSSLDPISRELLLKTLSKVDQRLLTPAFKQPVNLLWQEYICMYTLTVLSRGKTDGGLHN